MSRKTPIRVLTDTVADHDAVRAWRSLHPARSAPSSLEVWREVRKRAPASIYRLIFDDGASRAVYAKRTVDLAAERTMYEVILPRIPIRSPTYHGYVEDSDGTCWLFVEDVGSDAFLPRDPAHRALAARWAARLHVHGARIAAASGLPPAGADRYLGHLRTSRDRIARSVGNPTLGAKERTTLEGVLALENHLESRWDGIERRCAELPWTIVHGDLRAKNLRVRTEPAGVALYALDWETVGWGVPAPDLAPALHPEVTTQIDAEVYRSEVGAVWPQLDAAAIRGLSLLGHIFRSLAGIDWESLDLHYPAPEYLSKPVASLRVLSDSVWRALESDAAEWLA